MGHLLESNVIKCRIFSNGYSERPKTERSDFGFLENGSVAKLFRLSERFSSDFELSVC